MIKRISAGQPMRSDSASFLKIKKHHIAYLKAEHDGASGPELTAEKIDAMLESMTEDQRDYLEVVSGVSHEEGIVAGRHQILRENEKLQLLYRGFENNFFHHAPECGDRDEKSCVCGFDKWYSSVREELK